MTRQIVGLLFVVSICIFLTGCSDNSGVDPASTISVGDIQITLIPSGEQVDGGAYPDINADNPVDAYPGPDSATIELEPFVFQTAEPGGITVHGSLAVLDPTVLVPAKDDAIYLVQLQDGASIATIPPIVEGQSIKAEVDERTGEFVFINVPQGQYAVVVVTINGTQVPVRYYDTANFAIIKITEEDGGKTIEIGDLAL